jgi:hypothetical protein
MEIGRSGLVTTDLAQDRYQLSALVYIVLNLRVPENPGEFCSNWAIDGFSDLLNKRILRSNL